MLGNSALLVRIIELLLNEGDCVKFVGPEELLYLFEFVDEEEYLLAVEFEFEVGHAEVDGAAAPLYDAVVLH